MEKCNVAVVGCGIAGVATALAIQRAGHHSTIFEQGSGMNEVRKVLATDTPKKNHKKGEETQFPAGRRRHPTPAKLHPSPSEMGHPLYHRVLREQPFEYHSEVIQRWPSVIQTKRTYSSSRRAPSAASLSPPSRSSQMPCRRSFEARCDLSV